MKLILSQIKYFRMVLWIGVAGLGLMMVGAGQAPKQIIDQATGMAKTAVPMMDASAVNSENPNKVALLLVDGSINPGSASYLIDGITKAADDGYDLVVIQLDTPGGLVSATRDIVKAMFAAKIPVVVWVGPAGSHAGSAGVFITMAGHVAAMAPGTNIGAAHPVGAGGQDPDKKEGGHMAKKVENDVTAFVESIAEKRGRNKEWAIQSVRESESVTSTVAFEKKVIDLLADDLDDLMEKLHGRKVAMGGGVTKVLNTRGVKTTVLGMKFRDRLVNIFADPNIAYFLMMLGGLGLMMELYHPGAIFPGVLGGICLIMAFISFQVLPINIGAMLLILLGLGLFVAEVYVSSYGILGIGGTVALVVGGLLLIDTEHSDFRFEPGFGVSLQVILPMALALAGVFVFIAWSYARAHLRKVETGSSGMIGQTGKVVNRVDKDAGKVRIGDEFWEATIEASSEPIEEGAHIEVVGVMGLTVKVQLKA